MTKQNASLLILLGGTFMSFVGLMMRLLETNDGFLILAYRSIALAVVVMIVACLNRKTTPFKFLKSLNMNDVYMGMALAIAFTFYILAMINTSVASTLLILSIVPIITALFAWIFLGEFPVRLTWICMAGATIGVIIMVFDGLNSGRTLGNIFALISAISFAVMLIFARFSTQKDPLGGTFLAGLFSVAIGIGAALYFETGLTVSQTDLGLILFMGAFTIGIGIALVTWGTAFVPAAEASLLLLIESLLGPLWVWVFIGERMSIFELLGGMLVLVSIAALAVSQRTNKSWTDEW